MATATATQTTIERPPKSKYPGPYYHIQTAQQGGRGEGIEWVFFYRANGMFSALSVQESKDFANNLLIYNGKVKYSVSPLQSIRIVNSAFEPIWYHMPPLHEWIPADDLEPELPSDLTGGATMPKFWLFDNVRVKGHIDAKIYKIIGLKARQDINGWEFEYKLSGGAWYGEYQLEPTLEGVLARPMYQMGQLVTANGLQGRVEGVELVQMRTGQDYIYKVNGVWTLQGLIR